MLELTEDFHFYLPTLFITLSPLFSLCSISEHSLSESPKGSDVKVYEIIFKGCPKGRLILSSLRLHSA